MGSASALAWSSRPISIPLKHGMLQGNLNTVELARGAVLLACAVRGSRTGARTVAVADRLNQNGFSTLALELLTAEELESERRSARLRSDVGMLAERAGIATEWLTGLRGNRKLPAGYFGAGNTAAALLVAAGDYGSRIAALVLRNCRTDLAGEALSQVGSPTLLVAAPDDAAMVALAKQAMESIEAEKSLQMVAEDEVLHTLPVLAAGWFERYSGVPS